MSATTMGSPMRAMLVLGTGFLHRYPMSRLSLGNVTLVLEDLRQVRFTEYRWMSAKH